MPRETRSFPRYLAARLREALADTPAVLIHGPRQSGKTTLARIVGEPRGYRYVSFDDEAVQDAARGDPVGFVEGLPRRTILDEVQRVPELFSSLKAAIDERRTAGRFILTGSANVLLVPRLADSLAGRIGILRLHPLAQCELQGRRPRFIETLFRRGFRTRLTDLGTDVAERIVGGGYPAALARRTPVRRRAWYRDLVETQIQRDVRDVARIHSLDALPRLLALAASYTAQLLNVSDLAAPFQMTRQTIHDYVTVLERVFLVDRLPPWHSNRLSRLVKAAKLHMSDTPGLCAAGDRRPRVVPGARSARPAARDIRTAGTAASGELAPRPDRLISLPRPRRLRSGCRARTRQHGGRRCRGEGRRERERCGLPRTAQAARGGRPAVCHGCGAPYDGTAAMRFGDNLFAVPLRSLWEDS